jgi:hypothetical protein
LRVVLVAFGGVVALLGTTVGPAVAAEPGPIQVPALTGFVTDACTGLPVTGGLTVGIAPLVADPTTGMVDPGPVQSPPSPPFFGFFRYPTKDPGPIQLTVSAPGYKPLGGAPDPAAGGSPGAPVLKDPGPINLPAGQGLSIGLLLDIRLAPIAPSASCQPPGPPIFPAISGRGVDAATGRGLAGLVVAAAPLVLDPTTGMVDPGPIQSPARPPMFGLFSFRTFSGGPLGLQFYATAPGHTNLGADPAQPPGPSGQPGPGVPVLQDPGPIALPAGTGSMNVGLVVSLALPLIPSDFSIAATPAIQNVAAGTTASFSVTTAVTLGAPEMVALSASGLPAGVTASFNPASVSAGGSATMLISASVFAVNGPHVINVIGTAASGVHTAQVTVIVNGGTGP